MFEKQTASPKDDPKKKKRLGFLKTRLACCKKTREIDALNPARKGGPKELKKEMKWAL